MAAESDRKPQNMADGRGERRKHDAICNSKKFHIAHACF